MSPHDEPLVTPPPGGTSVPARADPEGAPGATDPAEGTRVGGPLPDVGASSPVSFATPYGLAPVAPQSSSAALLAVTSDGARLVATPRPDERTADGYLRVTARILLESQRNDVRSIGVVSAHEGEGRTAAALNLAVCLGRTKGRVGRVLLVDGDARGRALTRMFCGSSTPPVDGVEARHPMLIGTALEGVDLMTAPILDDGLTVSSPAAWISAFRELGAMYPYIVVDCPAVLENPEGMVLRECVEQIVLVARAGSSTRSGLQKTLGKTTAKVLGVILHGGPTTAETWR